MPLAGNIRAELTKNLIKYEGDFDYLYLDIRGKVTVGIGHLIPNRKAMSNITLYTTKNNKPYKIATLQEKHAEYDKIAKLPWGKRYGATYYKSYTTLVMKETDIRTLVNKQIDDFHKELTKIYSKAHGYHNDFDKMQRNVQLALFDMIFNLGATKLMHLFKNFNDSIKTQDWKKAAIESNRLDVSPARNHYVKMLLQSVPTAKAPKVSLERM